MRWAARVSWALPVLSAALMAVGITAAAATTATTGAAFLVGTLAFAAPVAAFTVVGVLITSRRPNHLVGWLLATIGLLFAVVVACSAVASWGLITGGIPRHAAEWIDVGGAAWVVALGLTGTQLLLRLPDGTLPSPRWRWYSRATLLLIAVTLVGVATTTGPVEGVEGTTNPLASATLSTLAFAIFGVIIGFVVSVIALVLRYRRASGHDRAQLRWVALSGAIFVLVYVTNLSLLGLVEEDSVAADVLTALMQTAFAALPLGIGFAVLRQRLYDINIVINRALVYGSLTAILASTYLGSVLLLQLALSTLTEGSGVAVAVSTLATAAVFRPARGRIQAIVDRRFFRRKYDAARILEHFGARVRAEVDLDLLTEELRAVVVETMQPAHVTLWTTGRPG